MRIRVYVNGEQKKDERITPEAVTAFRLDGGDVVCGVELPDGHELVRTRKHRGKRVLRIDLWTAPKD